jgi:hypothetical protein
MNSRKLLLAATLCLVVSGAVVAPAPAAETVAAAGIRYHRQNPRLEELPFDDGDLSYGLALEYSETAAYWQLAVQYAPDVTGGTNEIDYIITPQLNLLFTERGWTGGVGALASYIVDETEEEWTDVYWQFILGLKVPLLDRLSLDAHAYYVFEGWDELNGFDVESLEFAAWFHMPF